MKNEVVFVVVEKQKSKVINNDNKNVNKKLTKN